MNRLLSGPPLSFLQVFHERCQDYVEKPQEVQVHPDLQLIFHHILHLHQEAFLCNLPLLTVLLKSPLSVHHLEISM